MTGWERATDTRLATYGTLAPGRVNHHQLAGLQGQWQRGTVRGRLVDAGWAAALGHRGLVLDPLGPVVEVYLFESAELPNHWPRLDEFEGTHYRRVVTQVRTADGELDAWIYPTFPQFAREQHFNTSRAKQLPEVMIWHFTSRKRGRVPAAHQLTIKYS